MSPSRLAAAVLIAGTLAACVGEPPPPDHFYRLSVAPPAERLKRPLLDGTVEVARLSGDGLVGERALVYVLAEEPYEIRTYNYQFWNEVPGALVQEQLIRFLRAVNVAGRVVSPELRLPSDWSVEGRIHRFDQVVGKGVTMVIELELGLIRLEDEKLLLLETYHVEEPVTDASVPETVLATNRALSAIFSRFLGDLKGLGGKVKA